MLELDNLDINNSLVPMPEKSMESLPRRSTQLRRPPDRYGECVNTVNVSEHEPSTVTEAVTGTKSKNWLSPMEKEFNSIQYNIFWDLVP